MITIPIENYKLLLKLLERFKDESKTDDIQNDFENGYACASHYAYDGLSEALDSLPKLNKVCALCKKDMNNV
jgi:hypothetical protein